MFLTQAPIKDPLNDKNGVITGTWQDWFNLIVRMLGAKRNQQNIAWIPTFNASIFSTSGAITGTYTQSDNMIFFNITITPISGTTTSVLNNTWITNLPKSVQGNWVAQALDSGYADLGRGVIKASTTQVYTPSWSAVSGVITIVGNYITSE